MIIEPSSFRFNDFFQKKKVYPLWMMRQAGRYLPEYQKIRAQHQSFLSLCSNIKDATEVTIQPLRRFELDAAIIFSDILVPLLSWKNLSIKFEENLGPIVECHHNKLQLSSLESIDFVASIIEEVRIKIASQHHLIGFCGAPWTVFQYIQHGCASKYWSQSKSIFSEMQTIEYLDALTNQFIEYLWMQATAGANQLMIFDSWSSTCPFDRYEDYVIKPLLKITRSVKKKFPHLPIIYYPKGSVSLFIQKLPNEASIDIIACDEQVSISILQLTSSYLFQGNFRQELLLDDASSDIPACVKNFMSPIQKPFIINLNQGLTPNSSIDKIGSFIKKTRAYEQSTVLETSA
jgi:uroporphyrinogen decarboxylase